MSNEVTTVNVKKTASKKPSLLELARHRFDENQRLNSIFLTMEAGKPVIALLKGVGFREQEFQKGTSQVIDIKIENEDHQIKIASIPEFARQPTRDLIELMEAHQIDPTEMHPLGTTTNLKTYKWTATEDIPIIINPITTTTGRIYIGSIKEIPIDVLEG